MSVSAIQNVYIYFCRGIQKYPLFASINERFHCTRNIFSVVVDTFSGDEKHIWSILLTKCLQYQWNNLRGLVQFLFVPLLTPLNSIWRPNPAKVVSRLFVGHPLYTMAVFMQGRGYSWFKNPYPQKYALLQTIFLISFRYIIRFIDFIFMSKARRIMQSHRSHRPSPECLARISYCQHSLPPKKKMLTTLSIDVSR